MGLLITGMHRSGTSMLAQWTFRLGTRPPGGAEFPVDDANPRGLYESKDLVELNDGWLEQLGGSWWAPPRVKQQTWRSVDGVRLSRSREAVAGLRTSGGPPWFVKDPRISLLLPLWDRLLLDRLPILVAVRSHREVATSLNLRDGMTHRRALAVWLDYNRQLVRHGQDRRSLVVDYSAALADPGTILKALAQFAESEGISPDAEERRCGGVRGGTCSCGGNRSMRCGGRPNSWHRTWTSTFECSRWPTAAACPPSCPTHRTGWRKRWTNSASSGGSRSSWTGLVGTWKPSWKSGMPSGSGGTPSERSATASTGWRSICGSSPGCDA